MLLVVVNRNASVCQIALPGYGLWREAMHVHEEQPPQRVAVRKEELRRRGSHALKDVRAQHSETLILLWALGITISQMTTRHDATHYMRAQYPSGLVLSGVVSTALRRRVTRRLRRASGEVGLTITAGTSARAHVAKVVASLAGNMAGRS